ncbi:hypothetical protein [Algoriphagus namhaensis]
MRRLSEEEIIRVQKAIQVKEITSAEILMEIYDHYVSHLEKESAANFDQELFELEQKFTYSYCHALQAKLLKATKKDIHKTQWAIVKSYFTWPRFIGTLSALILLTYFWNNLEGKERGLVMVLPLGILVMVFMGIWFQSYQKVKKIKKAIGQKTVIQSSYFSNVMIQFMLVIGLFNMFIHIPKILGFEDEAFFDGIYFIVMSFILCLFYLTYCLSLIETWKIKSKSALI